MIVVSERGISRTVADADGYAPPSVGSQRGKPASGDLMVTGIKINGQLCTLTCHLIPPCVILIDQ